MPTDRRLSRAPRERKYAPIQRSPPRGGCAAAVAASSREVVRGSPSRGNGSELSYRQAGHPAVPTRTYLRRKPGWSPNVPPAGKFATEQQVHFRGGLPTVGLVGSPGQATYSIATRRADPEIAATTPSPLRARLLLASLLRFFVVKKEDKDSPMRRSPPRKPRLHRALHCSPEALPAARPGFSRRFQDLFPRSQDLCSGLQDLFFGFPDLFFASRPTFLASRISFSVSRSSFWFPGAPLGLPEIILRRPGSNPRRPAPNPRRPGSHSSPSDALSWAPGAQSWASDSHSSASGSLISFPGALFSVPGAPSPGI